MNTRQPPLKHLVNFAKDFRKILLICGILLPSPRQVEAYTVYVINATSCTAVDGNEPAGCSGSVCFHVNWCGGGGTLIGNIPPGGIGSGYASDLYNTWLHVTASGRGTVSTTWVNPSNRQIIYTISASAWF